MKHIAASVSLATVLVLACGETPSPTVPNAEPKTTPPATTATAPTASKLSADKCNAFHDEAQTEMDAEQIKVDHECKADGDCIAVTSHACDFKCSNAAIPKNDLGNWDAELKKVKDGPCKKWTDGDCATTTPPPAGFQCKDDKKPACVNKHCVMK